MSKAQPGLKLLALGLALGILADQVLRGLPLGLNATLFATSVVAAILWSQSSLGSRPGKGGIGYALAALAFAAFFAWRDALVLKALDLIGLAVALGLLASAREHLRGPASLGGYLLRVSGTAVHTAIGPPLLTGDIDWSSLKLRSLPPLLAGIGRGLLLTLPVLLVFTVLLVSADPVFGRRVGELLNVDLIALLGHVAFISIAAWTLSGLLRAASLRERPAHAFPARPGWLRLGHLEVAMVLGSVDLLFAGFVWIQVRYLFGGAQWVQQVAGLTYAEYARRGFFELCLVTMLVVPLLLGAHWLLKEESAGPKRTFAALAGTQVLLVLVMLASAFERMRLYRAEYGLTQLRFYTSAFMAWLAVLLLVFLGTVLRGRRDSFARAAIASAALAVFLLHLADPERLIVQANATLARGFDVRYALHLSADAVPALLDTLPGLDPTHSTALAQGLRRRWSAPDPDWRTWSLARSRCSDEMQRHEQDLRALATAVPVENEP